MALDDTSPVAEDWLWWSADGATLVAGTRGYVPTDGLYWFDAGSGAVRHVLYSSEAPYESVVSPFPIAGVQRMGFMAGDNNLYQCDLLDRSVALWLNQETLESDFNATGSLLREVSPIPNGPIDLHACLPDTASNISEPTVASECRRPFREAIDWTGVTWLLQTESITTLEWEEMMSIITRRSRRPVRTCSITVVKRDELSCTIWKTASSPGGRYKIAIER